MIHVTVEAEKSIRNVIIPTKVGDISCESFAYYCNRRYNNGYAVLKKRHYPN